MSIGRHRHQPLLLLKKPHTLLPCKAVQEKRTTLCTASLPIALIFIPTANIFLPLRFRMFTRSNRRKERRSSKEIALRLGLTPWRDLKYIRAAGTPRRKKQDLAQKNTSHKENPARLCSLVQRIRHTRFLFSCLQKGLSDRESF
jgi:hypothetical protein